MQESRMIGCSTAAAIMLAVAACLLGLAAVGQSAVVVQPSAVLSPSEQPLSSSGSLDDLLSATSSLDVFLSPTPTPSPATSQPVCSRQWGNHKWESNMMKAYQTVRYSTTERICRTKSIKYVDQYVCSFGFFCTATYAYRTEETCGIETVQREVRQKIKQDSMHAGYGFFKPVSAGETVYKNDMEIVWQLEAPAGSYVYLELRNMVLQKEPHQSCSDDVIEVRTDACHTPNTICNSTDEIYGFTTERPRVQVIFRSDNLGQATGFSGAYYYYPINSSIDPFEDAQRKLRERRLNDSLISNSSRINRLLGGRSRRRRLATKPTQSLRVSDVKAKPITKETEILTPQDDRHTFKTQPLTSQRIACIDKILRTENAEPFLHDNQCGMLAALFTSQGFYRP